jgi:hypothetical protein
MNPPLSLEQSTILIAKLLTQLLKVVQSVGIRLNA